ncbi:hypothetical protein Aduo_012150 [Ancylostoma duodenale]
MRRPTWTVLALIFVTILCLLYHNHLKSHASQNNYHGPDPRVKRHFGEWKECIEKNISSYQKDPREKKPSIIVSLGIGHDTKAEEGLLKLLPEGSKFYGADPIQEVNEELYSKFGSYFPFAVGGKSKVSKASVLVNNSYVDRRVLHIEFAYFLSEMIGHKVYDDIWIDAEGAEYELFPYFLREGKLDQKGLTLCQFNMEVNTSLAIQ